MPILPQPKNMDAPRVPIHRINVTGEDKETKQNSILAKVASADTIRRVKAISECSLWTMEKDRTLVQIDGTKCYSSDPTTGDCSCPDAVRVARLKRVMKGLDCHATIADKHLYIRALFAGLPISVYDPDTDALVARATLKPGQTKPTVDIRDVDAYARLLKAAYEISETELDKPQHEISAGKEA